VNGSDVILNIVILAIINSIENQLILASLAPLGTDTIIKTRRPTLNDMAKAFEDKQQTTQ
jgi:hypothetical protein